MEDFSDSTNRYIILLVFLFFYFYLTYRQTQLKMNKGFSQINCNPLQMVIGGMFDENEASETFTKCMKYSTNENMVKTVKTNKENQEKEINSILTELNNNQGVTEEEQKQKQAQLFKLLNQKTDNVTNLVEQQKLINQTMINSSDKISSIMTKIGDLSTKLKSIFNTLNN